MVEEGIAIDKIAEEAIKLIQKKIKNLKTLNVIVAGKTGVGKSTLINSVFKENLADTGMGKPVTTHMRKLSKAGVPLALYDTRGFELGKEVQTEVKQEVIDTINKGLASQDISQAIHCIWYCINTASNRIEPEEIEWLRELSKEEQITKVPIIVILTQAFSKKKAQEMRQVLLNENLDIAQVVPVLAEDYEIEDLGIAKAYGLDVLVKIMGEVLPEEVLETFQHLQIANLEEKKKHAQAAVVTAATAAVGIGAAPIPFADAALLVPAQIGMIATITVIFGFDVNKSTIAGIVSATLGGGGAAFLGRTVVSNLLKIIPGAGSIAGGAISAGTAGVLTVALGEAYIAIMAMVFNGEMSINDLGTKKGKETMTTLFKNQLKKQKKI